MSFFRSILTSLTALVLIRVPPLHVILQKGGIEERFLTMQALKARKNTKMH